MKLRDVTKTLEELGAKVPESTIMRWVRNGLVTPPARRRRQKGGGRGTVSEWSQQSLEEIAGCWAMREFGSGRRDFREAVRLTKLFHEIFRANPIGWQDYESKFREKYLRSDFNIEQKFVRDVTIDAYFRDWLEYEVAIEKVRKGRSLIIPQVCHFIFYYSGKWEDKTLTYRPLDAVFERKAADQNSLQVNIELKERALKWLDELEAGKKPLNHI